MDNCHDSATSFLAGNAETLRRELGRMFVAAQDCRAAGMKWNQIPVPSGAVDEFWHSFAESEGYPAFCQSKVGEQIKHIDANDPDGIGTGCGMIPWVTYYENRFGALDPIWFADGSGRVNAAAHARYKRDGLAFMPWNCNPKGLN